MAKITILTRMHNPGKYVYHCVDSVLNQTFKDFKFVIVDNASSDGTKEILEEYARKDARICLLRNELNNVSMLPCMQNLVETEYFMVLDHDDWLELNALEELYQLAEEKQLDIVFGQTNFRNSDERLLETRGYPNQLVTLSEELPNYLSHVYWQLRTTWAALIKKKLVANIDADTYYFREPAKYGGDTVLMLSMTFSADRIGYLNKPIHNYRMHFASESHAFCRERFMADWVLYDLAKKNLEKKNGFTKDNQCFLYRVYCNAICDTVTVAIKSGQNYEVIVSVMKEILEDSHTKEMLSVLRQSSVNAELRRFKKVFGENVYVLSTMNSEDFVKSFVEEWLKLLYQHLRVSTDDFEKLIKSDLMFHYLCVGNEAAICEWLFEEKQLRDTRFSNIRLAFLLTTETSIVALAQKLILLENEIADLYDRIPAYVEYLSKQIELLQGIKSINTKDVSGIVLRVVANQYEDALWLCLQMIQDDQEKDIDAVLQIALRLAAVLENAEAFVYLKKVECATLLENKNLVYAEEVLRDLEDMCPQDEQVQQLRLDFAKIMKD